MPTHLSAGVGVIGVATAASMAATILLTYTICVAQKNCVAWLPMISDTFVYFPETNISRLVLGVVCIIFGLLQYAIFWIDEPSSKLSSGWNKALLVIGWASCVLLSFVASVCESSVPSCRGNSTVHTTMAVAFFIGYNFCMIVITCYKPATRFELALLVGSLLAKARFLSAFIGLPEFPLGFPLLAVVEWVDVAIIMVWTGSYLAFKGRDLRMLILNSTVKGVDDPTPLSYWSMRFAAQITTVWYLGTLVVTAAIYHAQGRWPQGGLPFISDLWVYPPSNWISRWSTVSGATCGFLVHVCLYFLEHDAAAAPRKWALALTALASVAMLGLAIVGCVDESENGALHGFGAALFLGGYPVFAVLTVIRLLRDPDTPRGACAAAAAAAAVSCAAKLRFHAPTRAWLVALGGSLPQVLEWTDALSIAAFFLAYVASAGAKAAGIGLALVRAPSAGCAAAPTGDVGGDGLA